MNFALKNVNEIHQAQDRREKIADPVVIIGTGPVGIRMLQLIVKQEPDISAVIYGNEPWEPYNRVHLSTLLAGEMEWFDLVKNHSLPVSDNIEKRFNCAVSSIDRDKKYVIDESGFKQHYSRLIIATGSRPHLPQISGIELPGIYSFRDLTDVEHLIARRIRSRRTVIIGGGVLGLEAARAMTRENTEVHIIDHNPRLMSSQLDEQSAELVKEHLLALGIRVYLGTGIKYFSGQNRVTGLVLRNDIKIDCDTIVLATGIKPNIELARKAGIIVGRGIRVNDNLQTSDPDIYAIGECAEHRKTIYGLVAPGYEQAKVAAYSIQQDKNGKQRKKLANYKGSITTTTLKVVGIDVFSMGDVHEEISKGIISHHIYTNLGQGLYRKLIIKRGKLIGVISIGEWKQVGRAQEAITTGRYIWPWQLRKFTQTGDIWSEKQSENIAQWPASAKICNCTGVTRGELSQALSQGNNTVEELAVCTGASTVCGSCTPKLAELIGATPTIKPDLRYKSLFIFSAIALLLLSLITLVPNIIYNPSVDVLWQWDKLWRENLLKQITGFTAAGSMLIAALISLRKRWTAIKFFEYTNWRLAHTILGVIAITALVAHSGLRIGNNLNFYLMGTILALLIVGVLAGISISMQHKIDYVVAQTMKEKFLWAHILFVWPVPVLLGFHIFKTYYY